MDGPTPDHPPTFGSSAAPVHREKMPTDQIAQAVFLQQLQQQQAVKADATTIGLSAITTGVGASLRPSTSTGLRKSTSIQRIAPKAPVLLSKASSRPSSPANGIERGRGPSSSPSREERSGTPSKHERMPQQRAASAGGYRSHDLQRHLPVEVKGGGAHLDYAMPAPEATRTERAAARLEQKRRRVEDLQFNIRVLAKQPTEPSSSDDVDVAVPCERNLRAWRDFVDREVLRTVRRNLSDEDMEQLWRRTGVLVDASSAEEVAAAAAVEEKRRAHRQQREEARRREAAEVEGWRTTADESSRDDHGDDEDHRHDHHDGHRRRRRGDNDDGAVNHNGGGEASASASSRVDQPKRHKRRKDADVADDASSSSSPPKEPPSDARVRRSQRSAVRAIQEVERQRQHLDRARSEVAELEREEKAAAAEARSRAKDAYPPVPKQFQSVESRLLNTPQRTLTRRELEEEERAEKEKQENWLSRIRPLSAECERRLYPPPEITFRRKMSLKKDPVCHDISTRTAFIHQNRDPVKDRAAKELAARGGRNKNLTFTDATLLRLTDQDAQRRARTRERLEKQAVRQPEIKLEWRSESEAAERRKPFSKKKAVELHDVAIARRDQRLARAKQRHLDKSAPKEGPKKLSAAQQEAMAQRLCDDTQAAAAANLERLLRKCGATGPKCADKHAKKKTGKEMLELFDRLYDERQ